MVLPVVAVLGRAAAAAGQATARVGAAVGKQSVRVGVKGTKAITQKAARVTSKASRTASRKAAESARKTGSQARQKLQQGRKRAQQQGRRRGNGRKRNRRPDDYADQGDDDKERKRRRGKVGKARSLATLAAGGARRQGTQAWAGNAKPTSYGDADKLAGRWARRGGRRVATLAPRVATAPARFVINTFRPKKQVKRIRRLVIIVALSLLLLPFCVPLADDDNVSPAVTAALVAGLICDAQAGRLGTAETGADGTPSVTGSPTLTAGQMVDWWEDQGKGEPLSQVSMEELIGHYIDESRSTGVRGDVAFAQAIHETGWFSNADSRQRNNFAGIGNTSSRSAGYNYSSPREGVREHLELLASYADGSGPGSASTWGEVGNDWSGDDTGSQYWDLINSHYQSMLDHAGQSGPTVVATSTSGSIPSASPGPAPTRSGGTGIPANVDLEKVLRAIRSTETTAEGDYTNQNGWGASGAYQFLPGTWGGYGGYSEAYQAPPEVQDARARAHVGELFADLDGPWDRVISLGWYLGSGPTGAAPFMDMPMSDPRWDVPRDAFGTTARQYLERFRQHYDGDIGASSTDPAGALGCGTPMSATAGPCPVQGGTPDDSGNDFGQGRDDGGHQGIDIFVDEGTPVQAPAAGEVEFVFGNRGGRQYRLFAEGGAYYMGSHMDRYVRDGQQTTDPPSGRQQVEAGEVIGTVGRTGNAANTPPHLHWQYHPDGYGTAAVDPHDHYVQLCSASGGQVGPGGYSLPVDKSWYDQNASWFTKPHHDYPAADIPVPKGTPVYSVVAGVVSARVDDSTCGWGVVIDGDDGGSYSYCHASSVLGTMQSGTRVAAGQQIMVSGGVRGEPGAGRTSGAHLHVSLRLNGTLLCPGNLFVAAANGGTVDLGALPRSGCSN